MLISKDKRTEKELGVKKQFGSVLIAADQGISQIKIDEPI